MTDNAVTMMPTFINGLQTFQAGFTRLWSGLAESLPDRTLVGLRAQISVLDGINRAILPLRLQTKGWETAAQRLQNKLNRAEQRLAHRHAKSLFSDVVFCRLVFLTPFGAPSEDLSHREAVFRKIEQEGMDGYVDLLVSAINQHWAPVLMWERLRGGLLANAHLYDDMDDCQGPSVAIIVGLLHAVESDRHVETRFRERWNAFSPHYPLDTVRGRISSVAERYRWNSDYNP